MSKYAFLFFCNVLYLFVTSGVEGGEVFVSTSLGVIKGVEKLSRGGNTYYSFTGVPYAEPPIGDLRFQSPRPPKGWEGVWDATKPPPQCLCIGYVKEFYGKEDCLYLNVYTPSLNNNRTKLPVMVYIHGSRYWHGGAGPDKYGADYIMDYPIIFITFTYRLGPLGFLSTEDSAIPGNYGLKDAVAVLRWVRDHISDFGGDPTNVTLSGGSSGASSASLAMFSPLTKGLFHRCVSHSGNGLSRGNLMSPGASRKQAWALGNAVGCKTAHLNTSEQLLQCLKKVPGDKLVKINHDFLEFGFMLPGLVYGPVIEPKSEPEAFLTEDPSEYLAKSKKVGHMPWLLGMTADDGGISTIGFFEDRKVANELISNYEKYMPQIFGYGPSSDPKRVSQITDRIVKHFFKDGIVKEDYEIWTRMFTGSMFLINLKSTAELYGGPMYYYFYNYNHTYSMAILYGQMDYRFKAIHGDEILNFFLWAEFFPLTTEGTDRIVSERMLELWVNFMTTGEPNTKGKEIVWPQFNDADHRMRYLNITNPEFTVGENFMENEIKFWDEIYSS